MISFKPWPLYSRRLNLTTGLDVLQKRKFTYTCWDPNLGSSNPSTRCAHCAVRVWEASHGTGGVGWWDVDIGGVCSRGENLGWGFELLVEVCRSSA
jgi:hypothetical protein